MPTTVQRIFNFSAGPAVLPQPVLEEAQRDLISLPGVGMSILEISHRSKAFESIRIMDLRGREMCGIHKLIPPGRAAIWGMILNSRLNRDFARRLNGIGTASLGKAEAVQSWAVG